MTLPNKIEEVVETSPTNKDPCVHIGDTPYPNQPLYPYPPAYFPYPAPFIPIPQTQPLTPFPVIKPHAAVLSNSDIVQEVENGNIVIDPFDPSQLGNCSYDVRLGSHWYIAANNSGEYNPWDESDVKTMWEGPYHSQYRNGELGILLPPMTTILAHTDEFIGTRDGFVGMLKSRSGIRRSDLSIALDAGWGDVGYINRWTLEISSHHKYRHTWLPIGARVGQMVFLRVGPITGGTNYGEATKHGKYQQGTELAQIKRDWQPANMLPKLFKDYEFKDGKLAR